MESQDTKGKLEFAVMEAIRQFEKDCRVGSPGVSHRKIE